MKDAAPTAQASADADAGIQPVVVSDQDGLPEAEATAQASADASDGSPQDVHLAEVNHHEDPRKGVGRDPESGDALPTVLAPDERDRG